MSDARFPLDAEQIVRGVGYVLALWLNRTRSPDQVKLDLDGVTMVLAQKMGVPLPIVADENSATGRRLLPYGSKVMETSAERDSAAEAPLPSQPTGASPRTGRS